MSPLTLSAIIATTAFCAMFAGHYIEAWYYHHKRAYLAPFIAFLLLIGAVLYIGILITVQTGTIPQY